MFFVYILRTNKNTLYIGQTNNLEKRLKQHAAHNSDSAKYLKYFSSFELVYSEQLPTRSEAMKREWELKQLTRKQKEALILTNRIPL
jgi:putative endonuclease